MYERMLSLTRNKFPSSFLIWIPFTCFFGPICWAQQFWRSPVPTPSYSMVRWGWWQWCLRLKVGALYMDPDPWSAFPFWMLIFGFQHLFHLTLTGAGVAWVGGSGRWEGEAWEGWPWALDSGYRVRHKSPFIAFPSLHLPPLSFLIFGKRHEQSCMRSTSKAAHYVGHRDTWKRLFNCMSLSGSEKSPMMLSWSPQSPS